LRVRLSVVLRLFGWLCGPRNGQGAVISLLALAEQAGDKVRGDWARHFAGTIKCRLSSMLVTAML
jgi:hypothetical protein